MGKREKKQKLVSWGRSVDGCVKSACGRFEVLPGGEYKERHKSREGYTLVDSQEDTRIIRRTQALCKDAAESVLSVEAIRGQRVDTPEAPAEAPEPSKIKSPKDAKTRHKVRDVNKTSFDYLERVWAEDGVVKAQVKEDGRIVNMTVKDAAMRAAQINAMPLPDWHKKQRNELVRQIIAACKDAKYQMESPKDSRAAAMNNLLQGLAPDGRTPEQMMKDHPLEVQEALKMQGMFPHMSTEEIVAVLKEKQLGKDAQMRVLAEEENARSYAKMAEESRGSGG